MPRKTKRKGKNDCMRRKTRKYKYKGGQQMDTIQTQPPNFMTAPTYAKPKPDATIKQAPPPTLNAAKTDKKPILEMTKNNIPILYF